MKIKGFRLPAFILMRLTYGWGRAALASTAAYGARA